MQIAIGVRASDRSPRSSDQRHLQLVYYVLYSSYSISGIGISFVMDYCYHIMSQSHNNGNNPQARVREFVTTVSVTTVSVTTVIVTT